MKFISKNWSPLSIYIAASSIILTLALAGQQLSLDIRLATYHRVLESLLLGLGCLIAFVDLMFLRRSPSSWSETTLLLFLLLLIWCAIVSMRAEYSPQSWQDFGRFAGISLLCYWLSSDSKRVSYTSLLFLFFLPSFVYAVIFIAAYFDFFLIYKRFDSFWIPSFGNHRQFNNLQSIFMPILAYMTYSVVSRRPRSFLSFVAYFTFVIWGVIVLYTGARAVVLSLTCAFIFVSVFSRGRSFLPNRFWWKTLVLTVTLYIIFFQLASVLFDANANTNLARVGSSGRIELWAFTLSHLENCFWGCGGQSFAVFTTRDFHIPYGSAHNMPLMFLLEYGVFCFLLLSIILSRSVKNILFNVKTLENGNSYYIAAFISFGVNTLFSGANYTSVVGMVFPVVVGMYYSQNRPDHNSEVSRLIVVGFVSLCFCLMVMSIVVTGVDLLYYYDQLAEPGLKYPRFYDHGNFFVD